MKTRVGSFWGITPKLTSWLSDACIHPHTPNHFQVFSPGVGVNFLMKCSMFLEKGVLSLPAVGNYHSAIYCHNFGPLYILSGLVHYPCVCPPSLSSKPSVLKYSASLCASFTELGQKSFCFCKPFWFASNVGNPGALGNGSFPSVFCYTLYTLGIFFFLTWYQIFVSVSIWFGVLLWEGCCCCCFD